MMGPNGRPDPRLAQFAELLRQEPLFGECDAAALLAWWAHIDGLPVPAALFVAALDGRATPPAQVLAALRALRNAPSANGRGREAIARDVGAATAAAAR